MSSWNTNTWSNFCDSHWEFICHNKWHPGTSEISIPLEIAVGTQFHVWHAIKTIVVFLPADGEASWSLLSSLVSLLSSGQSAARKTYFCILKVTGQVWESQKRIIIGTTSVNLSKPVSTGLTIKSDLVLNQPNRKTWGAKLVDVIKHLPRKVFLSWYHH